MNTHTDPMPTTSPDDEPATAGVWTPERGWHNVTETERKRMQAETVRRLTGGRIPEWRRRSMEGRGRFEAVTDTTGLVAL
jgi:hypothetical protein